MKLLFTLLKILAGLALALLVTVVAVFLLVPGLHSSSLPMLFNVMTGSGADIGDDELLSRLRVRDGYHLSIFARDLPNPRMLLQTPGGQLLVTNPRSGELILLEDRDGDGAADQRRVLLAGLQRPQGIASWDRHLYIGESHQIGRVPFDPRSGLLSGEYTPVVTGLTDNGNHWSKIIRFDSKGMLYVAMGSTCNVCEEADPRRAAITRYNSRGGDETVYAGGLRNSVGMDFAPWNGELYATDNGRDLLGDNYPPCELNRVIEGGFYGWPYLNGENEPDPDFGVGRASLPTDAIAPVFNFRAHNAPLGIHFPRDDSRTALVALHGSWNRSSPDGYKVVRLHWNPAEQISGEDFVWGFEQDGDIVGRPVDIVGDGAGGFFISDDFARVIYRLSPRSDLKSAQSAISADKPDQRPRANTDPQAAAAGAALYAKLPCGSCHEADAATPVPLEGLTAKYDNASLADYFLAPGPPMPLFDLSPVQRRQLAHYLLSRELGQASE